MFEYFSRSLSKEIKIVIRRACTDLFHEFKFNSLASLARFRFCESAKPSENYNQQVCSSSVVSLIFFPKNCSPASGIVGAWYRELILYIHSEEFLADNSMGFRWEIVGEHFGKLSLARTCTPPTSGEILEYIVWWTRILLCIIFNSPWTAPT